MPSYTSYMRQMAVLDADDNEIESWITVRGNHIPIKKGQSKEDAVKSFIEKKGGSGEKKPESKKDGNSSEKGSNISGKFEVIGGSGIKHKTFETQEEAEKWAKENVNKVHTSLKVVSGYKKYKEYEPKKYEKSDGPKNILGERFVKTDVSWKDLRKGLEEGKTIGDMIGNRDDDIVYRVAGELAKITGEEHHDLYDKSEDNRRRGGSGNKTEKKVDNSAKKDKVYTGVMNKVRNFKAKEEGTYDYATGKPKDYSNGYSVSFHQNEPDDEGNWKSDYGRYSESEYDENAKQLVEETNGELNIGYFSGTPEVSVWVKDFRTAVKMAKKYNQNSIWNWKKGKVWINPNYDPKKNPMKQ